jgi:hypothetical protein
MAEDHGLRELQAQLRATPAAGLARLSDAQLGELARAVRDARRRQAAELEAAADQALRHIPKLLRGPIRRVMR